MSSQILACIVIHGYINIMYMYIYFIVRAGLPEIAAQECDAMKRLTSKKLNAVQCKHKWKGLVLTPEAHMNQEKVQTEVKTDRLDL